MAVISLAIRSKGFDQAAKKIREAGASAEQTGINLKRLQQSYSDKHVSKFIENQTRANAAMEQTRGKSASTASSVAAYQRKIEQLIKAGINPQSKSMQRLIKRYHELKTAQTRVVKSTKGFGDSMGNLAMAFGGGMALRGGLNKFMEFDTSVRRAGSITLTSKAEQDKLTKEVLKSASNSIYTSSQAANASEALMRSGMSLDESMKALPGSLQLAAAGNLDVAEAAKIASTALRSNKLHVSQLTRVNNVLAESSRRGNTDIQLLGESFGKVGSVAQNLGVDVAELGAVFSVLANNGSKGAEAGTLFRNALVQLAKPSQKAQKAFRKAGIEISKFVSKTGKIKDLPGYLAAIGNSSMSAVDNLESFGERGGRAINAFIGMSKTELSKLVKTIRESEAASKMAKRAFEGVSGAVREFGSTLDAQSNLLLNGSSAMSLIEKSVRGFTDALKYAGPEIITTTTVMVGLTTAAGVGRLAMLALGGSIKAVSGIAVAGGLAVISALVQRIASLRLESERLGYLKNNLEQFKNNNLINSIAKNNPIAKTALEIDELNKKIKGLKSAIAGVRANEIMGEDELERFVGNLDALIKKRNQLQSTLPNDLNKKNPINVDVNKSFGGKEALLSYEKELQELGALGIKEVKIDYEATMNEDLAQAQHLFESLKNQKILNDTELESLEKTHQQAISNIKLDANKKIIDEQAKHIQSVMSGMSDFFGNVGTVFKNLGMEQAEFAKIQQAISRVQAIMNIALGVTHFLSTGNIAGAVAMAAKGAIQVGVISSQTIPGHQTGTSPMGYSSLMNQRSGTDNNLVRITEGEKIIPRGEVEHSQPLHLTLNIDRYKIFEMVQEGIDNKEIVFNT